MKDPLGFLLHASGARTIPEASYRFARHEAPNAVILTGTGSYDHLVENVNAINAPPLPAADLAQLRTLFGALANLSGD
jgi:aryl-alcohol dehydrogenase-like predicted oxidoreductase